MISKEDLTKTGVNAVLGILGGLAFGVLGFVISKIMPLIGLGLGVFITVLGVKALFSKIKGERKTGLITALVGVVMILFFRKVPFVTSFAGMIFSIGAFASFGLGIYNGIRFLIGLKKRS